jgi:hypothetical protein
MTFFVIMYLFCVGLGRLVLHILDGVLNGGLESLGVGTDDLADLLAVLEEQEGGHGADVQFLGDIGNLVDVELEEGGVLVHAGVFCDGGSDDLARTAPGGETVEDNDLVVFDSLIPLCLGAVNSSVSTRTQGRRRRLNENLL